MEKIILIISIVGGIITIGTVIFYTGYNFRILSSLNKTSDELSVWKTGLIEILDKRYIRNDIFEEVMSRIRERGEKIESQLIEIHRILEEKRVLKRRDDNGD